MGLGSRISRGFRRATSSVRSALPTVAAFAANPLLAQDLIGSGVAGALTRGANPAAALRSGQAGLDVTGYSSQQWADLGAFNAALAAGAAGGAGLAGGFAGGEAGGLTAAQWAGQGVVMPGALVSPGAAALTGAGIGAATYGATQAVRAASGEGGSTPSTPPDVNEANDPQAAAQFARIRKAARAMGRAGTIKYKGSSTSLGLGEQVLGDQLALIGS